jgi:hypothetical protein
MRRKHELERRAARSAAPGEVQVWRAPDRSWRYRYVHAPRGTVIRSNLDYLSRDDAVRSARVAYPGVPVVELRAPPEGGPTARHRWRGVIVRLTGLGLLALAARAVARVVLRLRRSVRSTRTIAWWVGVVASIAGRPRPTRDDPSR